MDRQINHQEAITIEITLEYLGCNNTQDLELPEGIQVEEMIQPTSDYAVTRYLRFIKGEEVVEAVKIDSHQLMEGVYLDTYYLYQADEWVLADRLATIKLA